MNMATIDLEEPDEEDLLWMKDMIQKFLDETESKVAAQIIENWQSEHSYFIKVNN